VKKAVVHSDGESALPPSASQNKVKITLYRNGFTINDGPLRDLTAPENIAFIKDLERGVIPQGL
jgi:UBX domain-containing protein 1